jgi:hypothetical protein
MLEGEGFTVKVKVAPAQLEKVQFEYFLGTFNENGNFTYSQADEK